MSLLQIEFAQLIQPTVDPGFGAVSFVEYIRQGMIIRVYNSMHIHRTQERSVGVRYFNGGHRALTDVSPASQAMRCRAAISNGKASGWASHAEGGNC